MAISSSVSTRRTWLRQTADVVVLSSVISGAVAQNRSSSRLLPWPEDLRQASSLAHVRGEPMVIMVSLPGCPWCELLRRSYLGPMQNEGLAAYEFMINERHRSFADFKAQRSTPAAFSTAYKVSVTPTLLFLGREGQEIVARIEGVASADFIGAVLDERLALAREAIKARR